MVLIPSIRSKSQNKIHNLGYAEIVDGLNPFYQVQISKLDDCTADLYTGITGS